MKWDLLGTAAVTLALAAGAAQEAKATPYAYATTQYSNFSITGSAVSPSTFAGGTVATASLSSYTGFGAVNGTGGAAQAVTLTSNPGSDVTEAYTGPGVKPGQNLYSQQLVADPGTRGDAVVGNGNPFASFATSTASASDVAEGMIQETPASIDASATGSQSEALKFDLKAAAGSTITFQFKAADEVMATTTLPGDFAKAVITNQILINQIVGTSLVAGAGNSTFNPAALNTHANCSLNSALCNNTTTHALTNYTYTYTFTAAASYQISLSSTSVVQLDSAPVPEPASLVLLGTALLGVGGVVRRRRKS